MYRHIKNYELRYTDFDAYDNLKLSSLLSVLQESACLSADELGFGYNAVKGDNIGFILANWYVEIYSPVKISDVLEVHTWPLKPKHLIFIRDFELYVNGKKVGVISSRWCMINTETFAVVPIAKYFPEGFFDGYNTVRAVDFNNWKIPSAEKGNKSYSMRAGCSDYDHYFHVNNTRYADYLMDVFSVDEMRGKYFKAVQITYVKQCKEAEIIDYYKEEIDGCYLIEGRVGNELRIQMKVELGEL